MATVRKTTKTTETHTYHLELTQDEAQAVRDILGNVGGEYSTTRRRHADSVRVVLINAGLTYQGFDRGDITGEVKFL